VSTTVVLVRHAVHDVVDRVLVGRGADVGLSRHGHRQVAQLARGAAFRNCVAVASSPRLRAQQTARPIAAAAGCTLEISVGFDELDAGEWTGRSFAELDKDPRWHRWNASRSMARPPGGESMDEVQERAFDELARLRGRFPDQSVAIVSHAEPIRAVLLALKRIPVDGFAAVKVDPASMTVLRFVDGGWCIVRENVIPEASVTA
jgi:probable phosphoglycerate mutase